MNLTCDSIKNRVIVRLRILYFLEISLQWDFLHIWCNDNLWVARFRGGIYGDHHACNFNNSALYTHMHMHTYVVVDPWLAMLSSIMLVKNLMAHSSVACVLVCSYILADLYTVRGILVLKTWSRGPLFHENNGSPPRPNFCGI